MQTSVTDGLIAVCGILIACSSGDTSAQFLPILQWGGWCTLVTKDVNFVLRTTSPAKHY